MGVSQQWLNVPFCRHKVGPDLRAGRLRASRRTAIRSHSIPTRLAPETFGEKSMGNRLHEDVERKKPLADGRTFVSEWSRACFRTPRGQLETGPTRSRRTRGCSRSPGAAGPSAVRSG